MDTEELLDIAEEEALGSEVEERFADGHAELLREVGLVLEVHLFFVLASLRALD